MKFKSYRTCGTTMHQKQFVLHCLSGNDKKSVVLVHLFYLFQFHCCQVSTNDEADGDGDGNSGEDISSEMEVDTPLNESNLDQKNMTTNDSCLKEDVPEVVDGWTVVSRRNKGRRN